MNYGKNELSSLSRLFSATVFRELGRRGQSALFSRLIESSNLSNHVSRLATVGDAFEYAFGVLKQSGVRDEYVYRSAITQKVVLGRHSLNTASILSEARAGNCKADVVVLNGTSTAYEIKSERDSLNRLTNQLNNYRGVFAAVNVVTSPSHLQKVISTAPDDVGILVLSQRFTLQVEREAKISPDRTSPLMILETLRSSEASSILKSLNIDLPPVPNTKLRSVLKNQFTNLDPVLVHDQMVSTLKRTRSQAPIGDFVSSMPKSLKAAALSTKITNADRNRIKKAIDMPLDVALTWK